MHLDNRLIVHGHPDQEKIETLFKQKRTKHEQSEQTIEPETC